MLVLLTLLVGAVGFCPPAAHAGDEHGDSAALDCCVGMLGVPLTRAPLVVRAVIGRTVVPAHPAIAFFALGVLELPPKS